MIKKITLRLRYVKGSKEIMSWMGNDARMWDLIEPVFPEYQHTTSKYPTFTAEALLKLLKEKGII